MKHVMTRRAEDDYYAMLHSQAALSVGAEIIAICAGEQATHPGALAPHTRFYLFFKVRDDKHIQEVDDAISATYPE